MVLMIIPRLPSEILFEGRDGGWKNCAADKNIQSLVKNNFNIFTCSSRSRRRIYITKFLDPVLTKLV